MVHITNRNEVDICDVDIDLPETDTELTQEGIETILKRYANSWYGYTTKGDVIQHISEALSIPESIAQWMLEAYITMERIY